MPLSTRLALALALATCLAPAIAHAEDAPPPTPIAAQSAKFVIISLEGQPGHFLLIHTDPDSGDLLTETLTQAELAQWLIDHPADEQLPTTAPPAPAAAPAGLPQVEVGGYSSITYSQFDWETDAARRDAIDLQRFVVELNYHVSDDITGHAEIEFEHGGTGSTLEFDRFEEFGEFESEIEKGGEVSLEQAWIQKKFDDSLAVRIGHFVVPFGLLNKYHQPTQYFTVHRPEGESTILPTVWHETGIMLSGKLDEDFTYRAALINGLDSTGFSSANWIKPGHQGRFETINANDLALAARLDYKASDELEIGISGYVGDTGGNRPKPDVKVNAQVRLIDLYAVYQDGPFTARGSFLSGELDRSDIITQANKQLSNNLGVKRTPVGSAAEALGFEVGYDLWPALFEDAPPAPEAGETTAADYSGWNPRLDLFLRYDDYDTMAKVVEGIADNPRWDRRTWTLGLAYLFDPNAVLKVDYAQRHLGSDEDENTLSFGLGFEY